MLLIILNTFLGIVHSSPVFSNAVVSSVMVSNLMYIMSPIRLLLYFKFVLIRLITTVQAVV